MVTQLALVFFILKFLKFVIITTTHWFISLTDHRQLVSQVVQFFRSLIRIFHIIP